jgi:hypothetical protein
MQRYNLIGQALEEPGTFREAAYESVQAFKEALRQAFPQSKRVVDSIRNRERLRNYVFMRICLLLTERPEIDILPSHTFS